MPGKSVIGTPVIRYGALVLRIIGSGQRTSYLGTRMFLDYPLAQLGVYVA